ncbi:PDZ domain-containing protein [Nonomuraea sp. NN258]|uniref:S1C family serine protease n=1 Tax=Nonomuraea antri TaxID=2730852 RepID=UPI0015690B94|nr:trypsin-like peptidase domain-containing protein [Nonomuraea antri]NRQ35595.1 PDZ domain-containing protein [Nonomuraea antri]
MTDETRPTEGRMPSESPSSAEPQGRPDFLPADDSGEQPGQRPEPPASFGHSWGDPSGRPTESHGSRPYESPSYGPPAGRETPGGAQEPAANGAFGNPGGANSGGVSFESPSGGSYEILSHEPPRRDFAVPQGGSGGAFGSPQGSGAFGAPQGGGTRAYEMPPFPPAQPYGPGNPPPPPPRQAFGMGAGWAPPPPAQPGGIAFGAAPQRRTHATGFLVTLALVIALVASLLGSLGTYLLTKPSSANDPSFSLGPVPTGATNRAPDSIAGVAARVLPSVVSLEVGSGTEGASGSGFLIKNGYVVTNNHVVALAAKDDGEIEIRFHNRKTTRGRIVGRDPGSDLAVVKPEETFGTPEITLGNSDQVVVGDPVIAIGSPLGLTGTVTTGIVSSLNRPVIAGDEGGQGGVEEEPAFISAIQTDAAINPGNSGGPLVNSRGEVVGVNSAIATLSRSVGGQSGSIGLGFAIPVNQTRRVAEELITTGRAKRPKIGIMLDPTYKGQGVRIASEPREGNQPVDAGGPAAQAGLKPGDVILEIDGLRLEDGNELIALIRSKSPGAKLTIKYQRDGQERTATLTVVAEDGPTPTPS